MCECDLKDGFVSVNQDYYNKSGGGSNEAGSWIKDGKRILSFGLILMFISFEENCSR